MLWEYIGKVLSFAFRRTTPTIDSLQILAASAVPAIAWMLGYRMAPNITNDVLAYIGAVGVVFLFFRLLSAPYFIWREQVGEIAVMKLELSKPERLVIEHLARHRAKARAKLAAELEDFQTLAFIEEWSDAVNTMFSNQASKGRRLQAEAGLAEAFQQGRRQLLLAVMTEAKKPNAELPGDRESQRLLGLLQRYLVGDLTAEALALQLPQSIGAGTRQ